MILLVGELEMKVRFHSNLIQMTIDFLFDSSIRNEKLEFTLGII